MSALRHSKKIHGALIEKLETPRLDDAKIPSAEGPVCGGFCAP